MKINISILVESLTTANIVKNEYPLSSNYLNFVLDIDQPSFESKPHSAIYEFICNRFVDRAICEKTTAFIVSLLPFSDEGAWSRGVVG